MMEKIKITFEHKQIEVAKNTTYLEISKASILKDSVFSSEEKQ